jgi:hypothetical protein
MGDERGAEGVKRRRQDGTDEAQAEKRRDGTVMEVRDDECIDESTNSVEVEDERSEMKGEIR